MKKEYFLKIKHFKRVLKYRGTSLKYDTPY